MPALYALYVINKSGGLIYYKVRSKRRSGVWRFKLMKHMKLLCLQEFVPIASLNLNDTLRLASIWYWA